MNSGHSLSSLWKRCSEALCNGAHSVKSSAQNVFKDWRSATAFTLSCVAASGVVAVSKPQKGWADFVMHYTGNPFDVADCMSGGSTLKECISGSVTADLYFSGTLSSDGLIGGALLPSSTISCNGNTVSVSLSGYYYIQFKSGTIVDWSFHGRGNNADTNSAFPNVSINAAGRTNSEGQTDYALYSGKYNGDPYCIGWSTTPGTWTMGTVAPQVVTAAPKNNGDDMCPCPMEGNPINAATGNKFQAETDFAGAGAASGLTLTRYYNSMDKTTSAFGYNWRDTWHRELSYSKPASGSATVKIIQENGRIYTFTQTVAGAWAGDPDVTSKLSAVKNTSGTQTGWKLVRDDDSTELYNLTGQLTSVATRSGQTTKLAYVNGKLTTVTDAFGRKLTYEYDPVSGYVSKVVQPDGGVLGYGYTNGNLASVKFPDGSTKGYLYEDSDYVHALTGIEDEYGNRYATFKYDNGMAVSSEHAGGADKVNIEYTIGPDYLVSGSSVTNGNGAAHKYGFMSQYDIVKPTVIEQKGCDCGTGNGYTYDSNGFIASVKDFRGYITLYVRDAQGRELSRTEAAGTSEARIITTKWHTSLNLPTQITEPERVTTLAYDTKGNVLSKTIKDVTGASRKWAYTYNSFGQVLTVDGPRTDVKDITTYTYDSNGNLASIKNALGHITKIPEYDAEGRPLTIQDPNGLVTTLKYDARDRIISRTEGTEVTYYEYNPDGTLKKLTLPDGSELNYGYDKAHRLTSVSDKLGNSIVYTLDAMGNRIQEDTSDPDGKLTRTIKRAFDQFNRVSEVTGAKGQRTNYERDANGNITSVTDPLGNVTQSVFDALNRATKVIDPMGDTASTWYRADDVPTVVTDPNNVSTLLDYNGFKENLSEDSPDMGKTVKVYDSAGNLTQTTDANGAVVKYVYDALNRVTSVTPSSGSAIHFYYDDASVNGIGRMTSMTDASGSTSWAYDLNGHVTQVTQVINGKTLTTKYAYNERGQMVGMTYPSGREVVYGYDDDTGLPSYIEVDGETLIKNIAYAPFGGVVGWDTVDGSSYGRTYDQDGNISSITMGKYGIERYAYDDAGRLVKTSGNALSAKDYQYDDKGRLTHYKMAATSNVAGSEESYTYDPNGNRLSVGAAKGNKDYTYDGNLLMALAGAASEVFSYDKAGNATQMGDLGLAYDALGRMAQTGGVAHTCNGNGQRVEKTSIAGTTNYAYGLDGHSLLGEYGSDGEYQETIWIPSGPGGMAIPVLVMKKSGTYGVFPGALGEPQVIVDEDGRKMWEWDHDPFGTNKPNEMPSQTVPVDNEGNGIYFGSSDTSGCFIGTAFDVMPSLKDVKDWFRMASADAAEAPVPFAYNQRFPGQVYDSETGLHYNNARFYDPDTGRYTQSDPIGLNGGTNRFIYVNGNPVMAVDPRGEDWNVTLYEGRSGNPFGHIGLGGAHPNMSTSTIGYYGSPSASLTQLINGAPSAWMTDTSNPIKTITMQTRPWQDALIHLYIQNAINNPREYKLFSNNCATTAANSLNAGGLDVPNNLINPKELINKLKELQPFTPVPTSSPTLTPVPQL